jgi:CBS domain-containing membrane protein
MTQTVFTLAWHDSLETAAELMHVKHIRHLPVVDRDGDLVGLVTQRDLARSVLGATEDLPLSLRQDVLSRRKVREVMATEIDTAEPDTDLREAAAMLIENKIGCLPIVEGTRLVGILTEADFVRRFLEKG